MRILVTILVLCCGMKGLSAQSYRQYLSQGIIASDEGRYDDALQVFKKAVELKSDDAPGHYWLGMTMLKTQTENLGLPSKQHFQRVFELLGNKPLSRLNGLEKQYMEDACCYLAFYAFNPQNLHEPKLSDVDCKAAKPFIGRVLEINPSNTKIADVVQICAASNPPQPERKEK